MIRKQTNSTIVIIRFKSNLQFMKNVKWSNKGQENGNTPYCLPS